MGYKDNTRKIEQLLELEVINNNLLHIMEEVDSYQGGYETVIMFDDFESFFDTYYSDFDGIQRALRHAQYGSYNCNDDFVGFDGLGNLRTASQYDYYASLGYYAEDILDDFINLFEDLDWYCLKHRDEWSTIADIVRSEEESEEE